MVVIGIPMTTISSFSASRADVSAPRRILPEKGYGEGRLMGGPMDDPYMRELGRRAMVEIVGEDGAYRLMNDLDPDLTEDYDLEEEQPDPTPDPVLADFYGGISLLALAEARDGLEAAKASYEQAVITARTAGWTWSEVARVLGVSKQSLHSRFRGRAPG
jgi:hypothetical protein